MSCFAEKKGFSRFGSYTGNGNANGPFIFTGFKPAMVIYKKSSGTENWFIHDNKRQGYNPENELLFPDLSNAEATDNRIDLNRTADWNYKPNHNIQNDSVISHTHKDSTTVHNKSINEKFEETRPDNFALKAYIKY